MKMSNRERFKAIARFQRPGDLFIAEMMGKDLFPEWIKQGAPKDIAGDVRSQYGYYVNQSFRDYFRVDTKKILSGIKSGGGSGQKIDLGRGIQASNGSPLVPGFECKIINEDERTYTYINGTGQILKSLKGKTYSMPMYLGWAIKDRASWNELKKRLDPFSPARWPADWDSYVKECNNLDVPTILEVGGFYGYLREWIGSEKILYMFYDDPVLIEDIMDHILYMEMEIIKRVVKDIKVDEADLWEDMAYKVGPLISPDMVRKFIMPRHKKITELLRSNGIDIIYIDCDGNIEQLIPLWLESGINYVWPLEQAAGNDAIAYRKKYGKDLILGGAIDKRALLKGKEAIKEEIMSKVPFLLKKGGYFPSVDHIVPTGVTFENYCYYINTLREAAGLEKISF
jgi:hypothetical protein